MPNTLLNIELAMSIDGSVIEAQGQTPLIAAMKAFIASQEW